MDESIRQTEWAKQSHTLEFAEKAKVGDTTVGYKLLEFAQLIFVPLLAYGGYLLYCETCRTDLYEYPDIVLASLNDFMSGTVSDKAISVFILLVCVSIAFFLARQPYSVYCVDFVTYKGPEDLKVSNEGFMDITGTVENYTEESKSFQRRVLEAGKIGEDTTFPASIMREPRQLNMEGARKEARDVMCKTVEDLLLRTKVHPKQIDILVVNCSLFCPTPSLTAMLINHFQMRSDTLSYNLGGMGCSAGVISIDLAKRLLQHLPKGSTALVVSTENITQNWYHGNEKSMLLSNCLFRQGAAAILLCNGGKLARKAKLQLKQSIRTHRGAQREAYECVYQCQDADGYRGVRLSRQVMRIAGEALTQNITNLGPLVLPWSEQIRFFLNVLVRKVFRKNSLGQAGKALVGGLFDAPLLGRAAKYVCGCSGASREGGDGGKGKGEYSIKPYVPDFQKCFDHFCVHAGGRAVIDAIEKSLQLSAKKMEPSRKVLFRYGNVSSASIWYEMECVLNEEEDVCPGQTVWQIAFGSGFKCNSAVWKILRTK
jgi:3-ketoacyl-CoA synthase